MEIIDYNGIGRWSLQAIQERYTVYTRRLNVSVSIVGVKYPLFFFVKKSIMFRRNRYFMIEI